MVKFWGNSSVAASAWVDLHLHTTASDGRYEPSELIQIVTNAGVKLLAITDHETMNAFRKLSADTIPNELTILFGVECTTLFVPDPAQPQLHANLDILVYGLDVEQPATQAFLSQADLRNNLRMQKICEKLNDLGIPVKFEEVVALRRPNASLHIGLIVEALINSGYLSFSEQNIINFVNNIVSKQALATVKPLIDTNQLIEQAKALNAITIVAHPGHYSQPIVEYLPSIPADGFEVFHPANPPEITNKFLNHCLENNLIITGGSDFHGWFSPNYPFNAQLTAEKLAKFFQLLNFEVKYD